MTDPGRSHDSADVVVVGAGPVGLYLAIRLGRAGHSVIVVDKQPAPYPRPRAVTFDDEIARFFSEIGIDADHDPLTEVTDDTVLLRNAARETIAELDWRGVTPLGWHRLYWFHQPDLEQRLTELALSSGVSIRRAWELLSLDQDDTGVDLLGRSTPDADKRATRNLRGRYVVGADGARSRVREQAGLEYLDLGFHFDWLVCDVLPRSSNLHSEIRDGAMWQLCDPARPTTLVPGGPGRRRWEFMVLPGEDPEQLDTDEKVWALLTPWEISPETAELERHVVWRFQAKYATRWRNERVLIAGDAAHLLPPFAGQGMCAGIRDAAALQWRLDLVLHGWASPDLLDSYGTERQHHVSHFMQVSMELGKAICVTDPVAAETRDEMMKAALADPGLAPPPPPPLSLGPGVWRAEDPHAGRPAHQGIVAAHGRRGRFDEVVGTGWILLGLDHDPLDDLGESVRQAFHAIGGTSVAVGRGPVQDVDGTYAAWFAELGVDVLLIRPDFYVAAAVPRTVAGSAVGEVLRRVGVLRVPQPS